MKTPTWRQSVLSPDKMLVLFEKTWFLNLGEDGNQHFSSNLWDLKLLKSWHERLVSSRNKIIALNWICNWKVHPIAACFYSAGVKTETVLARHNNSWVKCKMFTVIIVDADIRYTDSHTPHHQVCYVRIAGLFFRNQQADVDWQFVQRPAIRQPPWPSTGRAVSSHRVNVWISVMI